MNGYAVFYTVLSGTVVFVFGQIILQFVIVPVQDFLKRLPRLFTPASNMPWSLQIRVPYQQSEWMKPLDT